MVIEFANAIIEWDAPPWANGSTTYFFFVTINGNNSGYINRGTNLHHTVTVPAGEWFHCGVYAKAANGTFSPVTEKDFFAPGEDADYESPLPWQHDIDEHKRQIDLRNAPMVDVDISWPPHNQVNIESIDLSIWVGTKVEHPNIIIPTDVNEITISRRQGEKFHYEVRAFYNDSSDVLLVAGDKIAGFPVDPPGNLRATFHTTCPNVSTIQATISGVAGIGAIAEVGTYTPNGVNGQHTLTFNGTDWEADIEDAVEFQDEDEEIEPSQLPMHLIAECSDGVFSFLATIESGITIVMGANGRIRKTLPDNTDELSNLFTGGTVILELPES